MCTLPLPTHVLVLGNVLHDLRNVARVVVQPSKLLWGAHHGVVAKVQRGEIGEASERKREAAYGVALETEHLQLGEFAHLCWVHSKLVPMEEKLYKGF